MRAMLWHKACTQGDLQLVQQLLEEEGAAEEVLDNHQDTPLHFAARYAAQEVHEAVVQMLLAAGADKEARNARQSTPLHIAAANGHEVVVQVQARQTLAYCST
mmetsp:Transcript_47869/g.82326  ORF Transcript_47869/g.82326 Transcript_47869/m.82326 type:complete len:103 (+) Transcript_47869:125-433(+)